MHERYNGTVLGEFVCVIAASKGADIKKKKEEKKNMFRETSITSLGETVFNISSINRK